MSDLFHIFKLTEQWGHNHLKHAQAYQTLRTFFPWATWLLLAHMASFAPLKQWPAAQNKHLLRALKTEPDPQSTSEFQMYTGAASLAEYIIQAFYELVERKGYVFLFVCLFHYRHGTFQKLSPLA